MISLQNIDREHAFGEADQQLLTTVAGSVSVALENARLVSETRQRVSELATVNSVGQALSSQLELDALIELVGEQVRETFEGDIAYVALHDEAAGRIEFAYYYEGGGRGTEPPIEYGTGLTSQIIHSREPLLLNREEHYEGQAEPRHAFPLLPRSADPRRQRGDRRDQRSSLERATRKAASEKPMLASSRQSRPT